MNGQLPLRMPSAQEIAAFEMDGFVVRGAVGALAGAVMRSATVRFVDDIVCVKEPRTEEATEWNDDSGGGATGTQRCSVCVSLADVPEACGQVRFLRGLHRRFKGWRAEGLRAAVLAQHDAGLGDVVAHHLDTIHAAGPNSSGAPRRSWALRFARHDGRLLLRPTRRGSREWYGLADGELLSGPRFSVAWPIAEGRRS